MPTYTVTTSNINLNSKKQKELAQGITKVHNVVTGIPEKSITTVETPTTSPNNNGSTI